MNREAILHRIDSEYAYPLDKNTLVLRLRVSKNDKFKSMVVIGNNNNQFIIKEEITLENTKPDVNNIIKTDVYVTSVDKKVIDG